MPARRTLARTITAAALTGLAASTAVHLAPPRAYTRALGPALTSLAPFTRRTHHAGALIGGLLAGIGSYRYGTLIAAATLGNYVITRPPQKPHTTREMSVAGHEVRILTHNVLTTNTTGAEGLAEFARTHQVDIVVVIEGTTPMMSSETDALTSIYDHTYLHNPTTPEAVAVHSRFPITDIEPVAAGNPRLGFGVYLDVDGTEMLLVAVHPKAPVKPSWVRQWRTDLHQIRDFVRNRRTPAVVVAGDFNADHSHSPFRELLHATPLNEDLNPGNTWPAHPIAPPFYGIDHILTGGPVEITKTTRTPAFGSDHRGVLATVNLH